MVPSRKFTPHHPFLIYNTKNLWRLFPALISLWATGYRDNDEGWITGVYFTRVFFIAEAFDDRQGTQAV